MEASDRPAFAGILKGYLDAFGRRASDVLIDAFWSTCSGMTLEEFAQACHRIVRDEDQYQPPAAVLGAAAVEGEQAWIQVQDAIRQCGANRCVRFEDPAIHAAIRSLGGWVTLCRMDDESFKFARRDFLLSFKLFRRQGVTFEGFPFLEGAQRAAIALGGGVPPAPSRVEGGRWKHPEHLALPPPPDPDPEARAETNRQKIAEILSGLVPAEDRCGDASE